MFKISTVTTLIISKTSPYLYGSAVQVFWNPVENGEIDLSFSHRVFIHCQKTFHHLNKFKIVLCKLCKFERV